MISQHPLGLLLCHVLLYKKPKTSCAKRIYRTVWLHIETFLDSAQYLLPKLKIKSILRQYNNVSLTTVKLGGGICGLERNESMTLIQYNYVHK